MTHAPEALASKHDPRCVEIAHPDVSNFILSVLILIGILVSYLPQHWRIIHRRSSEGLSAYFILLGTTSGTCAIANILVLPTSRKDVACCAVNSAFSCAAGLLGIAQVGVQWSCFFLISLLYLIFIPRNVSQRLDNQVTVRPSDSAWRAAVLVVGTAVAHFILTFLVSVIVLARYPDQLLIWANVLGTACAILASIQYFPQIWTTFKSKHIGSLSIPMMCIQTPGSFVFAGSLAVRLGPGGWSAWAVYIVTGCLQAILLAMSIIFERRDRKQAKAHAAVEHVDEDQDILREHLVNRATDDDDVSETENDPLLQHDRLTERQRRRMERDASGPLHPSRLRPEPFSSSSEGSPDQQSRRTPSLANITSSLTAPFRRASTRWFDAPSRRQTLEPEEQYISEAAAHSADGQRRYSGLGMPGTSTLHAETGSSTLNGKAGSNILNGRSGASTLNGRGAGASSSRANASRVQRSISEN